MVGNAPDDTYQRTVEALRDACGPLSATELGEKVDLPADKVQARYSIELPKAIHFALNACWYACRCS